MKRIFFTSALLVVTALLAGCARERHASTSSNARTMSFSQAGVALELGEEWQPKHMQSEHSLYPPTLVSDEGVIRVILLPPDRSEPGRIADGLRADFEQSSATLHHTFRRQEFVNDNGVRGTCVSFSQRSDTDSAHDLVNRHYLLKNRGGRCVVINYLASADHDGESVHHAIRNSLSLR